MANNNEQPDSEISTPIGVLVMIVCVIFDILSLIPFVGDIEDIPGGIILVLNIAMGAGAFLCVTQGVVMTLKAIPFLQEVPLWTPAWAFVWFAKAHPSKITDKALQVATEASAVEGGGAAGEIGEAGAAAEGAAAGAEAAEGAAAGTGAAAKEGGAIEGGAQAEGRAGEAGQEAEGGGPGGLEEEGGDAMGDLQEDLLEPESDEKEPSAPGPYQGDNIAQPDESEEDEPSGGAVPSPAPAPKPEPGRKNNVVEFPGQPDQLDMAA